MNFDDIPRLLAFLIGFVIYVVPLLLRVIQRRKQHAERTQGQAAGTEQPERWPEPHPDAQHEVEREVWPWPDSDRAPADAQHAPEPEATGDSRPQPWAPAATTPAVPDAMRQRSVAVRRGAPTVHAPGRPIQRETQQPSRSVATELPASIEERARSAGQRAAAAERLMRARVPKAEQLRNSSTSTVGHLSPQLVIEAVVLNTCLSRRNTGRR